MDAVWGLVLMFAVIVTIFGAFAVGIKLVKWGDK